jgi:signal transduction histidine kinase
MRPIHWAIIDWIAAAVLGLIVFASVRKSSVRADQAGYPIAFAHPSRLATALALLFVIVTVLAVALRRRRPRFMLGVLLGGSVVATMLSGPDPNALNYFLPVAYVLYIVAATYDTRESASRVLGAVVLTLLIDEVLLGLEGSVHGFWGNVSTMVPAALCVTIAWFAGYIVRQRRRYAIGLQEEAASKAVAEERLRIARELHDVVAHSMSVIAVQAGYGQYVLDAQPDDARAALGAIQATSREALDEMRRMLGALRQADEAAARGQAAPAAAAAASAGAAGPEAAADAKAAGTAVGTAGAAARTEDTDRLAAIPAAAIAAAAGYDDQDSSFPRPADALGALANLFRQAAAGAIPAAPSRADTAAVPLFPAPGLDDLDRLLNRTASAGVQVKLRRRGEPRPLPPSIDLSAYRVIQEALTNVVKHAHASRCDVVIEYGTTELTLRVTDSGAGVAVPAMAGAAAMARHALADPLPGGHGIIGMRERVSLLGGLFSAGPLPGYGFEVVARIPLPDGQG